MMQMTRPSTYCGLHHSSHQGRMGAEDAPYALPAELDTYIQDSIFHMLGFCPSEDQLKQKLVKSEDSRRDLSLKVHNLQLRISELEHKRSKSKEEAVLNALALKRQVAEGQKLSEQCQTLREEFSRLEQECSLYQNDREVFMVAAYEAEDRAAEAHDRAEEAEKKNRILTTELERAREALAQDNRIRLEMDDAEYVASLKARISHLEEINARLQEEDKSARGSGGMPELTNSEDLLKNVLSAAEKHTAETARELCDLKEELSFLKQQCATREDEQAVRGVVASAVTSGIWKALESEKEQSLAALNLEYTSVFKCLESELCGAHERIKFAEMNVQALLQEVQALRQDAALCRGNLDKAEVEVQMLADENKELRILLRRKFNGSESPMQNKGSRSGRSQSGGRNRPKTHEGHGDERESICVLCNARQPLMPLSANSVERKLNRRQNLAVDGNFYSRSPSSPSKDSLPRSIFKD